ncbi:DUF3221 domain-containing protein [Bacillus sp. AK128]
MEQYKEIKGKTLRKLDEVKISLIYLSYDQSSILRIGNRVEVWIEGGIDESFPAQARAKKIEVKK